MLGSIALAALALGPSIPVNDEARVYYDALKIPHIYADTDAAAFYALGYQQMRDFPITTLTTLWSASGRMAELAGKRFLDLDADVRHLRIGQQAAAIAADLATTQVAAREDILSLLQAYCDGLNDAREEFWVGNTDAIEELAGVISGEAAMHAEPVPFFLNDTSPHRPGNPRLPDDQRDDNWTALDALTRLLTPDETNEDYTITVDHVLRVGIMFQRQDYTWNLANGPINIFESPSSDPQALTPPGYSGSEGWLTTSDEEGTFTYACPHFPFHRAGYRGYPIQIEGDTYKVSGLALPGVPVIVMGYNEDISWWNTNDSASPFDRLGGGPNSASINGYYGAIPTAAPVVRNSWTATVTDATTADPPVLSFRAYHSALCAARRSQTCPSDVRLTIIQAELSLSYWDFSGRIVPNNVRIREWVSEYESGTTLLPQFPITEIPDDDDTENIVDLGETIVYEQVGPALETRSPWEFLIRMGRAPSISGSDPNCVENLVQTENMSFGGAGNLCAADDTGEFFYSLVASIPKQGSTLLNNSEERPWLRPDSQVSSLLIYDGDLMGYYWTGLHPQADLPSLVGTSTDQTWVMNNSTPNYVDNLQVAGGSIDLTEYPDHITDHGNGGLGFGTTRQWDVEDLLSAAAPISFSENQDIALSQRDPWSVLFWPYFDDYIRDAYTDEESPERVLAAFINDWKDELPTGDGDGGPDFIAHTASRVMPYMTLLRSYYETRVFEAFQVDLSDTDVNLLFAAHPYDPSRPTPTEVTGSSEYERTRDWMDAAIQDVIALRDNEGSAGGLANHVLLMTDDITSIPSDINFRISTELTPDPFNEHPWDIPSPAYNFFADGKLRWGHCQPLVSTPHFDSLFGSAETNRYLSWQISFYSSVWPEQFALLPDIANSFLDRRYYTASRVGVLPIGGVAESVFATAGRHINASYQNAVSEMYSGGSAERFYLLQFTSAGSVIWTVDLGPQDGQTANVGYYRTVAGATDFTADITDYSEQDGDDFFAPAEAYVRGTWTPLNVSSGGLDLRFPLEYTP